MSLLLVTANSDTVFRGPTYAKLQVKKPQHGFVAPNLLLTVLAVAAAVPFHQTDWPSPSKQVRAQAWQAPNLLCSTLAPTAAPFVQGDWPRLPLRRGLQSEVQTNFLPLTAVPFRPVDFQLQKAIARAVQQFDPPNLLGTTLAPAAGQPFSQTDWPIPRAAPRARDTWFAQNLLTITPPGAAPFAQQDWPRLQVRRGLQPDAVQNLLTGTLFAAPVAVPFSQLDWPLPRVVVRVPNWYNPQNLLTIAPVAVPFRQLEWPNPRVVRWQQPWTAPNLLTGTLAPAVVVAPFRQQDWPQLRLSYRIASETSWPALALPNPSPVVTPIYGFGARSRIGATPGLDPFSRIGSEQGRDPNESIGTETARDPNSSIGSEDA